MFSDGETGTTSVAARHVDHLVEWHTASNNATPTSKSSKINEMNPAPLKLYSSDICTLATMHMLRKFQRSTNPTWHTPMTDSLLRKTADVLSRGENPAQNNKPAASDKRAAVTTKKRTAWIL